MLWSEPNPIPKCDTNPNVGLCPRIPQNAAGMRMEPPWSPPNEMSTSPAATAAPEPEDDAGRAGRGFGGLGGGPKPPRAAAGPKAATQAVHDVLADDGAPRLQ